MFSAVCCAQFFLTDSDSVLCSILYQGFTVCACGNQGNGQAELTPTAGGVEAACGEPFKLGEMMTTSACTTSAYGDASFFIRYCILFVCFPAANFHAQCLYLCAHAAYFDVHLARLPFYQQQRAPPLIFLLFQAPTDRARLAAES